MKYAIAALVVVAGSLAATAQAAPRLPENVHVFNNMGIFDGTGVGLEGVDVPSIQSKRRRVKAEPWESGTWGINFATGGVTRSISPPLAGAAPPNAAAVHAALIRVAPLSGLDQIEGPPSGSGGEILLAFSDKNTSTVVQRISKGNDECARIPWIYRIDCLSQVYKSAARELSGKPDYRGARSALLDVSRKLDALARANRDPEEPRVRVGSRVYSPVSAAARASVNAAAVAILEEAETKLLRSGGSRTRSLHYQKIAQAVGSSTKVLLRS